MEVTIDELRYEVELYEVLKLARSDSEDSKIWERAATQMSHHVVIYRGRAYRVICYLGATRSGRPTPC